MTTQHTPTPWRINPNKCRTSPVEIERDNDISSDRHVASVYGPEGSDSTATANAAFIVKACNAHDANVARIAELEAALKPFTLLTIEGDDQMFGVYVDKFNVVRAKGSTLYDIERARAALAKVQP